jgi:alpha-L-arabinofuranosidase
VLSSVSLMDNNSLRRPEAVVPVETEIAIAGSEFEHEFPPRSLSIIRLKPQSE